MLVQWTTRDAGTPTVLYGTTAGNLSFNATGNTTTYTRCGLDSVLRWQACCSPGAPHLSCLGVLQADDVRPAGQHQRLDRPWSAARPACYACPLR